MFNDAKKSEIILESVNKQLKKVFNDLCFRDVSEKVIIEAKEFLNRKFEITKYGLSVYNKLGGRKGKWKKRKNRRTIRNI
jgi:hypothetical protein